VKQIVEVRRIEGVPLEYALAALVRGRGWVGLGGLPVAMSKMENAPEVADAICEALKDPEQGWSFCQTG